MKFFLTSLLMIISSSVFALSPKEAWQNANMRDKVKILDEYRDFYKQLDTQRTDDLSEFKTTYFYNIFLNDAYAATTSGMNCVYAGWPSKRVNNLCSSPKRQNPNYTSGNCGPSQMQCQPMLFGKDLCVPVSTQSQRNQAFTNCDKEFEASKKTTEDIINQIKDEKRESELFEFMDYAKEICSNGKQASTSMCRRLEGALDRMKTAADRLKESLEVAPIKERIIPLEIKKLTPQNLIDSKKIEISSPADLRVIDTVTKVLEKPIAEMVGVEVCEDPVVAERTLAPIPYERDSPRFTSTHYIGSKNSSDLFWDDRFTKYKEHSEEIPSGFEFTNSGPNSIADGAPLDPNEKVQRTWKFTTEDGSKQESYLWLTDDSGSGKFSDLMETIIFVVPRNVKPSIQLDGEDMVVTLPTGEKVVYDKMTRKVKSGVLKEGKVDLNPNRFNRKFAPIAYSGAGISIRVDKRGEDPRLFGGSATINQNGKTCKVPVSELWTTKADFKYADDAKLLKFLNTKCGNKFKM